MAVAGRRLNKKFAGSQVFIYALAGGTRHNIVPLLWCSFSSVYKCVRTKDVFLVKITDAYHFPTTILGRYGPFRTRFRQEWDIRLHRNVHALIANKHVSVK